MHLFCVDYKISEDNAKVSRSATVSATSKYDAKKVLKRVINQTRAIPVNIEIDGVALLEEGKDG